MHIKSDPQLLTLTCFRNLGPYKVGTNVYDDGLYLSDHRPVFADITLKPGDFPL